MDTDYFNIVEDVVKGDTLAPYLLRLYISTSVDLKKGNSVKEAEDTPHKQLRSWTPLMT